MKCKCGKDYAMVNGKSCFSSVCIRRVHYCVVINCILDRKNDTAYCERHYEKFMSAPELTPDWLKTL